MPKTNVWTLRKFQRISLLKYQLEEARTNALALFQSSFETEATRQQGIQMSNVLTPLISEIVETLALLTIDLEEDLEAATTAKSR